MLKKYLDAFFYSLMVGAGESFFSAYSIHLGFSELRTGFIITLPIVVGGIIQLISPYLINRIKSYKNVTLLAVFLQALTFLMLILLQTSIANNYWYFFALVIFYWTLALGMVPSWNTWLSSLLSKDQIRPFFSNRIAIMSLGTLLGLLMSGIILKFVPLDLMPFQKIFLLCFIFRMISLICLTLHERVEFQPIENIKSVYKTIQSKSADSYPMRFIQFSSLIKIGVYFSASFFAPYMLKVMELSYFEFTLILASAFSGRMILGRVARNFITRFDINIIYLLSAIGVALVPIFWTFSKSFYYIFFLEIFTGMLWGAFEMSFIIHCFEEIPTKEQGVFMTWYNFLHTLCIGIGSIAGLSTFYFLGNSLESYYTIFIISAGLRFLALYKFPRRIVTNETTIITTFIKQAGIRPNMGQVTKPMWQVWKKIKKDQDL